jgi:hypothetical protein
VSWRDRGKLRTIMVAAFSLCVLTGQLRSQNVATTVTPEVFAPGVISSSDSGESFGSLSRDGREFYYTIHRANFSGHRIVVARFDGTQWKRGETLRFSGRYNDREPKLSPDDSRLYFSSNRPTIAGDTARRRNLDLWFVEREPSGAWGAPHHLEARVNTDAQEFCPVVTSDGTLYFISNRSGGIGANGQMHNVWRAKPINQAADRYAAPENLGPAINTGVETNVYVSRDARVMLVSRDSAPDTLGGDDLYVSEFRGAVWEPMRHLPAPINSPGYDYGPLLSPDGRWLFFTSHRRGTADIYRVDSRVLELPSRDQRGSDERALIQQLDRAWLIQPYKTHDMSAYDTVVAPEFVITHSNGRTLTKAEKRADILASDVVQPDSPFAIASSAVRIFGDAAVSIGIITEKLSNVHFTNSYVRRDGQWRVVASQLTRVRRE